MSERKVLAGIEAREFAGLVVIGLACGCSALGSRCAEASDRTAPAEMLAPSVVSAQPAPLASATVQSVAARDELTSLGPDRLIAIAISGSPSVLARRAEVASATKDVETAKWQYFPTVGVGSQRLEGDTSTTITIKQPIWTAGRIEADVDSAKARVGVSDNTLLETKFDVASRVASTWGTALGAHGRCESHRVSIARLENLKAMMMRRLATGLSAQVELDLVVARIAQAKSDYAQALAELRSSLESLSQLVGTPLSIEKLKLLEEVATQTKGFAIKADHVERAVNSSATVLRYAAEIEYAGSQLERARKSVMPTLYAKYDSQHGQILGSLPADNRFYLAVEQSFGAGLSSVSNVDAAASKRDAALQNRDAALRDAAARIFGNIESYRAAVVYERDMAENLEAQMRVADSYNRMFLAGKRSWLDLLNMIREQSDAERQLATARVQRIVASYRIRLDDGEFWRD